MLERLSRTADYLGLEVETVATEAEQLPFEDESFDIVFGHAVLHHIPDLERAFGEFRRVLRPGGVIAFAGEPSRYGDRLAAIPKRTGMLAAPVWRSVVGAQPRLVAESEQSNGHALEGEVDVHAFAPADLRRLLQDAGFEERRVGGEELLANAWGWSLRTLESTAEPESVSWSWRKFAFNSYLALQKVDTRYLEPRLPAELFYNLLASGRKPGAPLSAVR
jgi:SAM-dependent methyltransferase